MGRRNASRAFTRKKRNEMNKKTIITVLLALVEMTGQAQDERIDTVIPKFLSNGYFFREMPQLPDGEKKHVAAKARRESNAKGGIGITHFYRKSIARIPNIHKTPEHLFRLSPRQTLFRSCRGLFRGTFCNFATRNDSRRRIQHDVNAPNGIFPRNNKKI